MTHDSPSFFQRIKQLLGFKQTPTLRESIEEVIEEHADHPDASLDQEEQDIIRNVLAFTELSVRDIMVPRADVKAIDQTCSFEELKAVFADKTHTRMPVYRDTLDDVQGFLHIKDLVGSTFRDQPFDMQSLVREVIFVPGSMKISDLLVKMQMKRVHMAVVIDEYGGTSGLVTMEDIVEEIIGEIEDEHDHDNIDEMLFQQISPSLFEVSARMNSKFLEEKLNMQFNGEDNEHYDTLGGLIFFVLGRVPSIGEVVPYTTRDGRKLEFEIKDADLRKIKRVLVRI